MDSAEQTLQLPPERERELTARGRNGFEFDPHDTVVVYEGSRKNPSEGWTILNPDKPEHDRKKGSVYRLYHQERRPKRVPAQDIMCNDIDLSLLREVETVQAEQSIITSPEVTSSTPVSSRFKDVAAISAKDYYLGK